MGDKTDNVSSTFLFMQASDFSDVDDWPTLGGTEVCIWVT